MIVYFLGGGAGGLPLLWSPKTITLLWFCGVCEGYPCPDCFFCNFLARFNKEFAVSGLGMVLEFQLALGSVVNLLAFGMGSTWILGDCLGGDVFLFFFFVELLLLNFSPGQKTFYYSGPLKQWV